MIRIRIQVGRLVLKSSGRGYVVGRPRPRRIKGRPTERIRRGTYFSRLSGAITYFSGRVLGRSKKPRERALASLLLTLLPVLTPGVYLGDVLRAVREAGGLSKSALARKAGVSRTTVKEAELHGRDLRSSTLYKLIRHSVVARW